MEILTLDESRIAAFKKNVGFLKEPFVSAVMKLFSYSDYVFRNNEHLHRLLQEDSCNKPFASKDYTQLISRIPIDSSIPTFMRNLRYFRHRHLLRLLVREAAGIAETGETLRSWSYCADSIIGYTLQFIQHLLSQQFGIPETKGECSDLVVLAMGKLGGNELNFSSDIDLIFCYSADGYTNGSNGIPNQVFFNKVIQQCIHILQTNTEDGFVFRVDLRLRPYGESGPLVLSFPAMDTYYQEQGRDWERYAMVKARLIHPNPPSQQWFEQLINPFVYRKYVDYSVIESLRSMKALIEREIQLKPMLNDIKRGRGGIREIEFIVQCFQLIRGGRLPGIRKKNTVEALKTLKEHHLLTHTLALIKAYLFLRKLENCLQAQNDLQIHSLPANADLQKKIALGMGFESWGLLYKKLEKYRTIVSLSFNSILSSPDHYGDERKVLINQLANIWQGQIESSMAANLLESLKYTDAARCIQMLQSFRNSPKCRRLSQTARMRLDRFMPILLVALQGKSNTELILLQVLQLLENIVSRSAYIALLIENPDVLQEIIYWFANSSFITSLLSSQPFLLEVLIDQKISWKPPSKTILADQLQNRLALCNEEGQKEEMLKQFKLTSFLLAARAEHYGYCTAQHVSQFLSNVAEIILNNVLSLAISQLSKKYPQIVNIKNQFAMVAYGKLGSQEMNYNSDLDLVFLYNTSQTKEGILNRLTQKILHLLTTRSQTGTLYNVDTRLRPSGSAGLLVSHIDAFSTYQINNAWTWEHQALIKTRVLTSSAKIKKQFIALKREVLLQKRNKRVLAKEILEMKEKIQRNSSLKEQEVSNQLLAIEFLVQFLILANPVEALLQCTNTGKQLKELCMLRLLSETQFETLSKAYLQCHKVLHQCILYSNPDKTGVADTTDKIIKKILGVRKSPIKGVKN